MTRVGHTGKRKDRRETVLIREALRIGAAIEEAREARGARAAIDRIGYRWKRHTRL